MSMTLNLEEEKIIIIIELHYKKLHNFSSYSRLEQAHSFCFYLVKAGNEILWFLAVAGSS